MTDLFLHSLHASLGPVTYDGHTCVAIFFFSFLTGYYEKLTSRRTSGILQLESVYNY